MTTDQLPADGQWHHLAALCRDAPDPDEVYIDGQTVDDGRQPPT